VVHFCAADAQDGCPADYSSSPSLCLPDDILKLAGCIWITVVEQYDAP
jgi:hypothetical protein